MPPHHTHTHSQTFPVLSQHSLVVAWYCQACHMDFASLNNPLRLCSSVDDTERAMNAAGKHGDKEHNHYYHCGRHGWHPAEIEKGLNIILFDFTLITFACMVGILFQGYYLQSEIIVNQKYLVVNVFFFFFVQLYRVLSRFTVVHCTNLLFKGIIIFKQKHL